MRYEKPGRRLVIKNISWTLPPAVCAVLAAVVMVSGCATPHATIQLTALSTVAAGTPFTVTATVMYQGQRDTITNGQIHFSSSDRRAILPPDYIFTPADDGSKTWANGFTLMTPGIQSITADLYNASGINGTVKVSVSP